WRRFLAQFRDPLVYLLIAAGVISVVAWMVEGARGWPVDALVIAAIVLLNAVLSCVREAKGSNGVAALERVNEVSSSVLRDGSVHRIPSRELVPGDVLLLGEGDAVGADARLAVAAALRVQEASLTGESAPVTKGVAALAVDTAIADRRCMVFK